MNRFEFYSNLEKFKNNKQNESEQSDSLQHYGTLGQKWGVRKWQNYDGTFNEAGKERYFGSNGTTKKKSEENKVGSAKSEAKDYLKFRNKMLKERTRPDLNQWYRDQHKKDDKQLVKNAKKVDKSREKMYRDQLKDFYDDPNELVADLKNVYKISGQPGKNNTSIPKKIYEANKNDPQALKILEDYYKNHRDKENKDPETEAMDKFYNEKEEQKLGGLFNKGKTIVNDNGYFNTKYQNEDGSLTKKGEKLLKKAEEYPEKGYHLDGLIDKELLEKYNTKIKNNSPEQISANYEKIKDIANNAGLRNGEYSWENDLGTILKSNKEYYDSQAKAAIAKNDKVISKMIEALDNDDWDTYWELRNSNFDDDYEKDVSEKFINDVRKIKDIYNEREKIIKEVDDSIGKNTNKYLERNGSLRYEHKNYKDGKPDFVGEYEFEDYKPGQSKATEATKELEKNANKHFDKILDKLYDKIKTSDGIDVWDDDHNKLSRSEFKDYMKDQKYKLVNSGHIDDSGNIGLYLNDADLFYGHVFGIDYNPLTGEFDYHGIEG